MCIYIYICIYVILYFGRSSWNVGRWHSDSHNFRCFLVWLWTGSSKGTNWNFGNLELICLLHQAFRVAGLGCLRLCIMGGAKWVGRGWASATWDSQPMESNEWWEGRFQCWRCRICSQIWLKSDMLRSDHAWSPNNWIILNHAEHVPLYTIVCFITRKGRTSRVALYSKEIIRRSSSTRSSHVARWFVEALLPNRRT